MSETTPDPSVRVLLSARVADYLEGTNLFQDPENEADKADPYAPAALRIWATREPVGGGLRVTATAADVDGLDWLLDRVETMALGGFEPPDQVAGAKAVERLKSARTEVTSPPVTLAVDVTAPGRALVTGRSGKVGMSALIGRSGTSLRKFYGELTEVDGMDDWSKLAVPGEYVVHAGTYAAVAVALARRIGWAGVVSVEIDHEYKRY